MDELISIHAPRTGSDLVAEAHAGRDGISIHAPRTGSDAGCCIIGCCAAHFNPRSPHGERRHRHPCCGSAVPISIHAPRTGSDDFLFSSRILPSISIHAPRTGSDCEVIFFDPAA